ncbi:hypothetical protein EDB83DRAFT_2683346 [Lactarius deliciosus]|nr:hypothetical protein EDB83DRAFT_2683346 [Lactarius deliciosus]
MRDQYRRTNSMDDETDTLVTGDYSPEEKLQGESSSVGGLGSLFDMYLKMAQVEDEKLVQNWNAVVNGSLTFSGLFSAVVATFLGISIQDLKPDPQDKPAFYLDNIYQLLADSNRTRLPTLPTQSNPFTFSPPVATQRRLEGSVTGTPGTPNDVNEWY